MPRVTLRFHPDARDAIVDEIMDSYVMEANARIDFPTPDTATLVLPSRFVIEELANEAASSPLCHDILLSAIA
jgi:hypothetical protein